MYSDLQLQHVAHDQTLLQEYQDSKGRNDTWVYFWCVRLLSVVNMDILAFPGTRDNNQRIDGDWQQHLRILMYVYS